MTFAASGYPGTTQTGCVSVTVLGATERHVREQILDGKGRIETNKSCADCFRLRVPAKVAERSKIGLVRSDEVWMQLEDGSAHSDRRLVLAFEQMQQGRRTVYKEVLPARRDKLTMALQRSLRPSQIALDEIIGRAEMERKR